MPSPFPGMDPYLEGSPWFSTIHQRLITYLADEITESLPPHYVANIGERVYVADMADREQDIYPDVLLVQSPPENSSGVALAEPALAVADAPLRIANLEEERREVFVEILSLNNEDEVITLIEVLSPANKSHGTRGHKAYVAKQQMILESDTHLIEIDLLRQGLHTVAASRSAILEKAPCDYCVCLHRALEDYFDVWVAPCANACRALKCRLKAKTPI